MRSYEKDSMLEFIQVIRELSGSARGSMFCEVPEIWMARIKCSIQVYSLSHLNLRLTVNRQAITADIQSLMLLLNYPSVSVRPLKISFIAVVLFFKCILHAEFMFCR